MPGFFCLTTSANNPVILYVALYVFVKLAACLHPLGGRTRFTMKKIITFIAFVIIASALPAQDIKVRLSATKNITSESPVYIPLKRPLLDDTTYVLVYPKIKKEVPLQLINDTTLVVMSGSLQPGTVDYIIRPGLHDSAPVRIEVQDKGLLVKVKHKPLLFYNTEVIMPPAGSPDYYKRSGFIHPLYSPDGSVLTDDFPAGHMHQHGIFLTWVNTTFRGKPLDFWNQHNKTGTVEHYEVLAIEEGPVFSRITTELRHISLVHGPVLSEIWTIIIYASADRFMFDLESVQTNITSDTLYINKYHYGGLAFRGSREWNSHDSLHFRNRWQIRTSEGKDTSNANHTHARWVDVSGKVNGKMNGVTILGDASNFRYPQFIRLHPDMPYWCYSPMVESGFTLNPGEPYRSRFRFVVHVGSPSVQQIEGDMIRQILF